MCEKDETKKRCECGPLHVIHEINIQKGHTSVFACGCPTHCTCKCAHCFCSIKFVTKQRFPYQ